MKQAPNELEQVKHRYNPEHFHSKSLRLLDEVTSDQCKEWYMHPCTQALVNGLEGDISGVVLTWLGGGYSKEDSSDVTAQRSAKARGIAQAINDMLDSINNIRDNVVEGEPYNVD